MSDMRLQLILEAVNRTDKAFADLQRDVRRSTDGVDHLGNRGVAATDRLGRGARAAGAEFGGMSQGISLTVGKLLILGYAVSRIGGLVERLVFDFNSKLETAGLGIASAYMSAGTYIDATTGKALEGADALAAAQADSRRMVEELQVANFQTIATLDQLVRAYQETLPVAMAKGFDRKQVKEFTTAMVQAAGAIGLSLDQLGEETRSILTGAINPRTSRIATVLGLRNEDVAEFKGNADGLFAFLMDKLAAYRLAGIESQKTWAGVWSNSLDLFNQVAAKVGEPLFEGVKRDLQDLADSIVDIDEETGKIEWNPEFLAGVEDLKKGISSIYTLMTAVGNVVKSLAGPALGDWLALMTVMADMVDSLAKLDSEKDGKGLERFFDAVGRSIANTLGPIASLVHRVSELKKLTASAPSNVTFPAPPRPVEYKENPPAAVEETEVERNKRLKGFIKEGNETPEDPWLRDIKDRQRVIESDYKVRAEMEKEHQAEVDLYWTESTVNWEQQHKDRQEVSERHYAALKKDAQELSQFTIQAFFNIQSATADYIEGGLANFDKFGENLAGIFRRIAAEWIAQMALMKLVGEDFTKTGEMGGLIGAGLSFVGGLFGGGSSAGGAVSGAKTLSTGAVVNPGGGVWRFHGGGEVSTKERPMLVPRFHFGGLLQDEVPMIGQTGERVLSRDQNKIFDKLAAFLDGGTRGPGGGNTHIDARSTVSGSDNRKLGTMMQREVEATVLRVLKEHS